jgi:hypothetical protein
MQCLIIPLEFCATRFTLGLLQISVAVLVCLSVFFFFLKKKKNSLLLFHFGYYISNGV